MMVIRWAALLVPALVLNEFAAGQSLTLRTELGQREFFEGQPIYVGFRLANPTHDTIFVPMFAIATGDVQVVITRADGTRVPERVRIADYVTGPKWRGIPVPPLGSLYEPFVLQDRFGEPRPVRRSVFLNRLPPGAYQITARFSLGRLRRELIVAEPAAFVVRARTPSEDEQFARVERVMALSGRETGAQYFAALLASLEDRARTPDDPFMAYMLNQGMQIANYSGGTTDSGLRRIADMRESIVIARASTVAAAVIMSSIISNTPERLASITQRLPPGPAKDVGMQEMRSRP